MSKAAKTKREVGQKAEIMQRYRQLHREVMDYAEHKLAVDNDLDLFSSLCKYADTIEKKIWDLQGVILKLQMPEILKS